MLKEKYFVALTTSNRGLCQGKECPFSRMSVRTHPHPKEHKHESTLIFSWDCFVFIKAWIVNSTRNFLHDISYSSKGETKETKPMKYQPHIGITITKLTTHINRSPRGSKSPRQTSEISNMHIIIHHNNVLNSAFIWTLIDWTTQPANSKRQPTAAFQLITGVDSLDKFWGWTIIFLAHINVMCWMPLTSSQIKHHSYQLHITSY